MCLTATSDQMKSAAENLNSSPTLYELHAGKGTRTGAMQKRVDKSKKMVEDVPQTTPDKEDTLTILANCLTRNATNTVRRGEDLPTPLRWEVFQL